MQPILDGAAGLAFLGLMHASSIGHVVLLNYVRTHKPKEEEEEEQKKKEEDWGRINCLLRDAIALVLLAIFVLIGRIFASAFINCDSVIGRLDICVIGIFTLAEIVFAIVFYKSYCRRR